LWSPEACAYAAICSLVNVTERVLKLPDQL
jgi:hypothetical protein